CEGAPEVGCAPVGRSPHLFGRAVDVQGPSVGVGGDPGEVAVDVEPAVVAVEVEREIVRTSRGHGDGDPRVLELRPLAHGHLGGLAPAADLEAGGAVARAGGGELHGGLVDIGGLDV